LTQHVYTCTILIVRVVEREKITPIHEQLEQVIMTQIRSGQLKPGDKAFSEPAFAEMQRVSRSTVRMVYDRLVARGVLVRRPGKGTYVAFPATTENVNLLVGFSEKMRSVGEVPKTRLLGLEVVEASGDISAALQVKRGDKVIRIRRLRLIQNRPFVTHSAVLSFPLCRAVLDVDLEQTSLTAVLESTLGFRLQKAEETISACPATVDDCRLLEVPRGFPVLVVQGLTFDQNGRPLRLSIGRYRSDLVRLQTFHQREKDTN
jgi:GntR family transcriptional regulator